MTKLSLFTRTLMVAGMVLLVAMSAQSAYAAAPSTGVAPVARILIVDLRRAVTTSKVGQSIQEQVNKLKSQAQAELKGEAAALRKEKAALEQQAAILAPAVKAKKAKAFEARVASFQKKLNERGQLIQGGMLKANQKVEDALGPILRGIMQERHASVMLDRTSVLIAPPGLDVTAVVIQRLDLKMPSVKVELTPLPPGVAEAAARQREEQ